MFNKTQSSFMAAPLALVLLGAVVGGTAAFSYSRAFLPTSVIDDDEDQDEEAIELEHAPAPVQEIVATLNAKKITSIVREERELHQAICYG